MKKILWILSACAYGVLQAMAVDYTLNNRLHLDFSLPIFGWKSFFYPVIFAPIVEELALRGAMTCILLYFLFPIVTNKYSEAYGSHLLFKFQNNAKKNDFVNTFWKLPSRIWLSAICTQAVFFGVPHGFNLYPFSWIFALQTTLGGFVLGCFFWKSRSLIPPIFAHIVYNLWAMTVN